MKNKEDMLYDDVPELKGTIEEDGAEKKYEWADLKSQLESTCLPGQIQDFFLLEAETAYASILTGVAIAAKAKAEGVISTQRECFDLGIAMAEMIAGKISRQPAPSAIVAPVMGPVAPTGLGN